MTPDLKHFGQLLASAQFELYAFVCILMESENDASDVLQDTNLALWNHAERYDASLPFLPWARSFAYNQVRAFRSKQSRSRLVFDEELLDWFAEHASTESIDTRYPAEVMGHLESCLSKLTEEQRRILKLNYIGGSSLKEMASQLGRSVVSVGVMLHRIRASLALCMKRNVGAGGAL